MPMRKQSFEDKSKPTTNFILFLPIRFDISSKDAIMKALDFEIANCDKTRSQAWREMIFEELKITNEKDLILDIDINKKIIEIKEILDRKMKIPLRGRSKFLLSLMTKKYLKEGDDDKKI